MQRRQITLEDGRYLIFYTFTEDAAAASANDETAAREEAAGDLAPSQVQPEAEEERRV